MIENDFVTKLKSDLFYSNVGSTGTVRLAVITNREGFWDLRIDELRGIVAFSDWGLEYYHRSNGSVDLVEYLSKVAYDLGNCACCQVDYYLRSYYLVIVRKEICV